MDSPIAHNQRLQNIGGAIRLGVLGVFILIAAVVFVGTVLFILFS